MGAKTAELFVRVLGVASTLPWLYSGLPASRKIRLSNSTRGSTLTCREGAGEPEALSGVSAWGQSGQDGHQEQWGGSIHDIANTELTFPDLNRQRSHRHALLNCSRFITW